MIRFLFVCLLAVAAVRAQAGTGMMVIEGADGPVRAVSRAIDENIVSFFGRHLRP